MTLHKTKRREEKKKKRVNTKHKTKEKEKKRNKEKKKEKGKKITIDKMPLNIVHVGEILRFFPNAKFILALRHPYDCVLSCFMQPFLPNDAMSNFYNLKDASNFYDLIMNFPLFIPIPDIAKRFSEILDKYPVTPYLDSRESIIKWVVFIHNKINIMLNKKTIN